jgi:hypothetical protein
MQVKKEIEMENTPRKNQSLIKKNSTAGADKSYARLDSPV